MTRWIAFATLAALISGCVADSSSLPATAPAVLPSHGTPLDTTAPDDPSDVTYVGWKDTGFAVIKSATADALFEAVATCTSDGGGYTVEYPASWHTNEDGEAPGCSWFGPEPFAHAPATLVRLSRPLDVPIGLLVVRTGLGRIPEWPRLLAEDVVIGGVDGQRTEDLVPGEPPEFIYGYSAWLDPEPLGLKFTAGTESAPGGDDLRAYVLNKAVLDRMMATLELTAGAASPPVALPTPSATYVERAGYPFPVIDSAEADALFETPDTCTNPVAGYTVTYPDVWYTNTEIGDWPACTWFSPSFYEVGEDPNEVPPQVAIVLHFGDMSFGYTDEPDFSVADDLTVDGFAATRAELIGHTAPSGIYFSSYPMYWYIVTIQELPGDEPTLYARTDFEGAADYELNKAVLDRIMARIVFDETH